MRAIIPASAASALAAVILAAAPVTPAWATGTVPDAPTAVTASGADGALLVSWTAPASTGGEPITQYTATAYDSASGGTAVSSCPASGALTCTIGSLTSGTTYHVEVTATNANGTGAASSPRVSAMAGSVPGIPRSVSAVRTRDGITVTWTAPSSDGGSAVTGYTAQAFTSTSASATVVASCSTSGLECAITGLDAATTTYVSVLATNAVGSGPASSRTTVAAGGVPGAPQGVKAPRGNGFSRVTWSAPSSTGNSAITRYNVQAWTAPEGGSPIANCQPARTSSLTCDLGPLPNGTTYYVDVIATNAFGDGPASAPRVAVLTATTPSTPRDVTVTRAGGEVHVRWASPASDGGRPITSYVATAYTTEAGTAVAGTCTANGPFCSIPGLRGAPVFVSVVARTEIGDSPASSPRAKVRVIDSASPPLAIAGSARPEGIAVSWRPPVNDGGRPILAYTAAAFSAPTGGQSLGTCLVAVTKANAEAAAGADRRIGCTIRGLTPDTIAYLAVTATTEFGSTPSAQRTAVRVRQGRPLAPREVIGLPASTRIEVAWTLPAADGGRPILEYRAQAWTEQRGGELVDACEVAPQRGASDYRCTLRVPRDFEPYWVLTQARTERGWGAASARVAMEAKPAVPSAPQDVRVTPGTGSVRVDWVEPDGDGGYPITRYVATAYSAATGGSVLGSCTVSAERQDDPEPGPATVCTITGLSPDAYAYVEVTAENTVGVSSPSARVASHASPVL